ncbi:MAG: M48 family metallopeptidase [Planctomycetota bacterium]|nr:M48 family metallopeptidase [Planctomycetota bacterium]
MPPTPDDFTHPLDRAALERLKSVPLFPSCVKAFMKLLPERALHGLNMANKVRLGPQQLPKIYRHLPPVCKAFGIPEPEFYLEMNPFPNAYTYGDKRVFITVTSGLVQHLEEEELRSVVAHECGHIVCQHVLYHTMAQMLVRLGAVVFGPLAALSMPVQLALLYWVRRSELSADRAAAVAMRGPLPVIQSIIRLAGGPKAITEDINLELYAKQTESYDKLLESTWDQILQGMVIMAQSHPFMAVRAREITKWCRTPEFRKALLKVDGLKYAARCAKCGQTLAPRRKTCTFCGAKVTGRSKTKR